MQAILIGLVLFTIPLAVLYQMIVDNLGVSLLMTIIMIVAGFVFTSVSAYMAGTGRVVEQPRLWHHDLHDPVRVPVAARVDGQGCRARARSRRS
jgi:hypothetical protein